MIDNDILIDKDESNDESVNIEVCNENHMLLQNKDLTLAIKDSSGKTYIIKVDIFERIYELKEKLFDKHGLKLHDQHLYYNGIQLESKELLKDLDVNNMSVLNLINDLKGGMQISVKSVEGKILTLEVSENETVENLKMKIYEKSGISPKLIKLVLLGTILDNDKLVKNTNISDKSVINMFILLRHPMEIYVKSSAEKTIAVEVFGNESVKNTKVKICEKTGFLPEDIILTFKGINLNNDDLIKNANISDNSLIDMKIILPKDHMKIFGRTSDGKTVAILARGNEIVEKIKLKFHEKTGLDPDEMRLEFQGGILQDDHSIEEYKIVEKSVISILAKLKPASHIIVRWMDKYFTINILYDNTVKGIKKQMEMKIGRSCKDTLLIYYGKFLMDDYLITDHMQDGDRCDLVPYLKGGGDGTSVIIKIMDGKTFPFKIRFDETVEDFKKLICEKTGISPQSMRLLFQGEVFDNDELITNAKIPDESVIYMVTLQGGPISITIKLPNSGTTKLKMYKQDTIHEMKRQIFQSTKIKVPNQKVICNGETLEDNRTLGDYEIQNNDVLNLILDSNEN